METYGWRAGYKALGLMVVVAWPVILALLILSGVGKSTGHAQQRKQLGSPLQTLCQPPMLRLLLAFFCTAIATGGAVVHFVPMLIDAGYSQSRAAGMASLMGLCLTACRVLVGIASDRVFAPRLAMVLTSVSAIGFLLVPLGGAEALPYVAVLVGLSLGAEVDLLVYLTSRYFQPKLYGHAFGVLYPSFLIGAAVSPVIYAELEKARGDYSTGFIWAGVFLAVSTLLFGTLPRFPTRDGC